MKRTASMRSRVPPEVTTTFLPASGPDAEVARARRTAMRIASGDAIRPDPSSPQASSPLSVGSTSTPRSASTRRFSTVAACSFIAQFMVGATITGPRKAR